MNKKKKTLIFLAILFLLLALIILYIFSELYTESNIEENKTDALKFKEEYEILNNDDKYISVEVNEKNPIKYKNPQDIIKSIEERKSFVVYFGYAECSMCRSVLPTFMKKINELGVKTVYYVNLKDIRDFYELDDSHKLIKTKEGSKEYYQLLEIFDEVLNNYKPLTYIDSDGNDVEVTVDEKKIYAPTFIVVEDGSPVNSTKDIETFALEQDTLDENSLDLNSIFDELLRDYKISNTCSIDNKEC